VELVCLDAIAGWEFRRGSGRVLEAGWAHGSAAVDPALETRLLDHRSEDDNRRRHCGIYALCDWLAGADLQWLRAVGESDAYFSHDHGFYLTGPQWSISTLEAGRDQPYGLSVPPDRLDPMELERCARALESVTRDQIEEVLSKLPAAWPVDNDELEAVATFADLRRLPVATRLRALVS